MSALVGAFGSFVGYLGAEVAERTIIERLLWPQRFYHDLSLATILKMAIFMPMGGPLHRAALETLDQFRDKGLYRGTGRGHMLGTAFFADMDCVRYVDRNSQSEGLKQVRNGFWVRVLQCVNQRQFLSQRASRNHVSDAESKDLQGLPPPRSRQVIFRLDLEASDQANLQMSSQTAERVQETMSTYRTILGIVASEVSTIIIAVTVACWRHSYWLCGYLLIPLILKLLSLVCSVRREELCLPKSNLKQDKEQKQAGACITSANATTTLASNVEAGVFEVVCPDLGFVLITSTTPQVVYQFFRHYGHPVRHTRGDRLRETSSIAMVYALVLYFPAGLLASLWMDQWSQILWLAYQLYTIVVMHVVRITGMRVCGQTEERVARLLQNNRVVYLCGSEGHGVVAKLALEVVDSVALGKERVRELVNEAKG